MTKLITVVVTAAIVGAVAYAPVGAAAATADNAALQKAKADCKAAHGDAPSAITVCT